MASNIKIPKRRGPLPTGKGTLVGVRLQPDDLKALDKWVRRLGKHGGRPEAIRQLVRFGIATDKIVRGLSNQRSLYASELAAAKISALLYPKDFADLKFELLVPKKPD